MSITFSKNKDCFIYDSIIYDTSCITQIYSNLFLSQPLLLFSNNKTTKTTYIQQFFHKVNKTFLDIHKLLIDNNIITNSFITNSYNDVCVIHLQDYDKIQTKQNDIINSIKNQIIMNKKKYFIVCIDNIDFYSKQTQQHIQECIDYIHGSYNNVSFVFTCSDKQNILPSFLSRCIVQTLNYFKYEQIIFWFKFMCIHNTPIFEIDYSNHNNITANTKNTIQNIQTYINNYDYDIFKNTKIYTLQKILYIERNIQEYHIKNNIIEKYTPFKVYIGVETELINYFKLIECFVINTYNKTPKPDINSQKSIPTITTLLEKTESIQQSFYYIHDLLTIFTNFLQYTIVDKHFKIITERNKHLLISEIVSIIQTNVKYKPMETIQILYTIISTIKQFV